MSKETTYYQAINPATGEKLEGEFKNSTWEDVDQAAQNAAKAFQVYRRLDNETKAKFLETIADEILALGDALLERCNLETALPLGRLTGERGRTMNQLKLFASVVREGSWVDARIDLAQPNREPLPKSDIRHMLIPLGPVAVFGASNFPLAFSTAGGDTASALAAGCPVVYKGHPAHPGTTEMIAGAIQKAVEKIGLPEGVFSLVQGTSIEVGENLVKHSAIKAVGFTGSYNGGMAIFNYANSRPIPIPVFSEMGSTNPMFILPGALKERASQLAQGYSNSLNMGVGQFCTNPGLSFYPKGDKSNEFLEVLSNQIKATEPATMLTAGIQSAYNKGLEELSGTKDLEVLGEGKSAGGGIGVCSKVFKTTIDTYLKNSKLSEENFGPSSILVEASAKEDLLNAARNLEGHLTATVHATEADLEEYAELFEILEQKVGRVLVNGYPTGVEVCHSMVHGGPFPATTAPSSTSVGTNAIKRFVRPVCYQDYPQSLLPPELKNDNPLGIWRLVDGEFSQKSV
ncbi:aldehyde dehydrogenase (NADP(+)) [Maribacter aurantiacus]|uniref:Aldehyde dehydrogenase (NADP(+)) n=1 Tax=Maribacter aurantiacus TaxID=1882343 RepID=A0A5R8M9I4_9FLAO|nr:aldehyde dehydrogenase (NADP(+)) [Maribacter aurantiacus]TLF46218.1 aldehyde dehydrogenase (NADP(+)) [Maribacter aurantiacus]